MLSDGRFLNGIVKGVALSKQITGTSDRTSSLLLATTVLVPVAARVVYPITKLLVDPLAGMAMALSSVSVVLNASRLRFT